MWKNQLFSFQICNKSVPCIVNKVLKFWINGLFYITVCTYFCKQMNHLSKTILKSAAKKLAVLVLVAGTAVASFATLGDGNKKSSSKTPLMSAKTYSPGTFSLRSGYTYRGNQVINPQASKQYINLNTSVTYQRGNTTFIVPLKKKVIISNIKISLGNRQFQRN